MAAHELRISTGRPPSACSDVHPKELAAIRPVSRFAAGGRSVTLLQTREGPDGFAPAGGHEMRTDPSTELLHTIAEVLDIREVFPRVSEIANHVLPHDWLGLMFHDQSDRLTLQARPAESFPEFQRLAVAGDGDEQVVGDIAKERRRILQSHPPDFVDRILAEGYRSLLKVRSIAGEQEM